jgi:hypothetical protein
MIKYIMPTYRLITLVDITNSYATRAETDVVKRGQQSNFHTLIQTIGLRSNLEWTNDPIRQTGTVPLQLGSGKAAWWDWTFIVEREAVFADGNSAVGLLMLDLHGVPVVANLTETADLNPAAFLVSGSKKNTCVEDI